MIQIKYLVYLLMGLLSFSMFGQEVDQDKLQDYFSYNLDSIQGAQQDIYLISKRDDAGIHFRWAPSSPYVWQMGKEYGYTLQGRSTKTLQYEDVQDQSIMPWPETKWKANIAKGNKYLQVAATSMYGETSIESGFVNEANDVANRHGFSLLTADLDKEAAEAQGLYYYLPQDTTNTYIDYRIYIYAPKENYSSDTAIVSSPLDLSKEMFPPELLAKGKDGAIELKWKGMASYRANRKYTAYHIERSVDNKNFSRLTDVPFMNTGASRINNSKYTVYIDSVENDRTYTYRVIGVDAFADISAPSEVVSVSALDLTPPDAVSDFTITELSGEKLKLQWKWNGSDKLSNSDVAGFNIYRSYGKKKDYVKLNDNILSPNKRSFVDDNPDIRRLNFYYVESVDVNGNAAKSLINYNQIVDVTPPQSPTNLTAEIDTNGMVLLQWSAPKDDDIQGYEIFFSNSAKNRFSKINAPIVSETFFVDSITLETLTKNIHYKVVAVDYNFNRSEHSEYVSAKRPDIVPPATSIFTKYEVSPEGIYFEWLPSSSNDVSAIRLDRRTADTDWKVMDSFDSKLLQYMDRDVSEGILYIYRLVTEDDAGNVSYNSDPLKLEALKSFYLPMFHAVSVEKNKGKLVLNWEYDPNNIHEFVIYRKEGQEPMRTLKRLKEVNMYIDATAKEGKQYRYAIKAVGLDGRESELYETDIISL